MSSKSMPAADERAKKKLSPRFVLALLLILGGIAWVAWYYTSVRPDPTVFPAEKGSPKAMPHLGGWTYVIGFGALMLGLAMAAHPSTPLGRGRAVVIGMLGCFLVGLVWICTFYIFSDDLSPLPVLNDLGQWNLVVGISFMAVGFSFATKWE